MRSRNNAPERLSHGRLTLPGVSLNLLVGGAPGILSSMYLPHWADARLLQIGLAALLAVAAYSLLGQGMAITLGLLRRCLSPPS